MYLQIKDLSCETFFLSGTGRGEGSALREYQAPGGAQGQPGAQHQRQGRVTTHALVRGLIFYLINHF